MLESCLVVWEPSFNALTTKPPGQGPSRLTLHFPCLSPRINQFSKDSFYWYLETRPGMLISHFQWTAIYKYTNLCIYTLSLFIFISPPKHESIWIPLISIWHPRFHSIPPLSWFITSFLWETWLSLSTTYLFTCQFNSSSPIKREKQICKVGCFVCMQFFLSSTLQHKTKTLLYQGQLLSSHSLQLDLFVTVCISSHTQVTLKNRQTNQQTLYTVKFMVYNFTGFEKCINYVLNITVPFSTDSSIHESLNIPSMIP